MTTGTELNHRLKTLRTLYMAQLEYMSKKQLLTFSVANYFIPPTQDKMQLLSFDLCTDTITL